MKTTEAQTYTSVRLKTATHDALAKAHLAHIRRNSKATSKAKFLDLVIYEGLAAVAEKKL